MNNFSYFLTLVVSIFSIVFYCIIQQPPEKLYELNKCPYCYGIDFCDVFKNNLVVLKKDNALNLFRNYISVKNVFYAYYKNTNVVLKKLGHDSELNDFDKQICAENNLQTNCNIEQLQDYQNYTEKLIQSVTNLTTNENSFRICSSSAMEKFLGYLLKSNKSIGIQKDILLKNIWTTLHMNVEPLLLQLLNSTEWPVPYYYGACGRVIIEEDCGSNLNSYEHADWNIRAFLSLQLLEAAQNFTFKHPDFRFYVTDVSPDNIVVSASLKVTFVDLEDVIIVEKYHTGLDFKIHYSDNFVDGGEHGFAFSQNEICESNVSDHNYYAVCKLLLSKTSPWPMMENGLLHSPPVLIKDGYPSLFNLVEDCVQPSGRMDRFEVVEEIINVLKQITYVD